jgi:hypothetical protein
MGISINTTLVSSLVLGCNLSGCTSLEWWPEFDEKKMRSTIVVGTFDSVHYLKDPPCFLAPPTDEEIIQNREKGILDTICLDPSPLAVRVLVDEVVYGQLPREEFFAVTTSHSGDEVLKYLIGKPLLIVVETDGENYLVSRYQYDRLRRLTNGDWALPIASDDELYPLPCAAQQFVKRQHFASPKPFDDFDPTSDYGKERIAQTKFAKIAQDGMYIEQGISLKAIRKVLAENKPDFETYSCK